MSDCLFGCSKQYDTTHRRQSPLELITSRKYIAGMMINWPSFPVDTDMFYFPNKPLLACQNAVKGTVLIPPALPNVNLVDVFHVSKRSYEGLACKHHLRAARESTSARC